MRVFVTGATGFIGQAVVDELVHAGHAVLGVARNEAGAAALKAKGVDVFYGDLSDPAGLAEGAAGCDGVIHLAFIHEFDKFLENIQTDRRAVDAMLAALAGTGKPFIGTSGTAMGAALGRPATEDDAPDAEGFAALRGATETAVIEASKRGVRSIAIRLPQVHDTGDRAGFVGYLVESCHKAGVAAYIGEGDNHWPAAHRSDVARLYRLALEHGEAGNRLHAVGEAGVRLRDIAEVISKGLGVPLKSVTADEAAQMFGFLGAFLAMDNIASNEITRRSMNWEPTGPKLFDDLPTHSLFRHS